MDSDSDVVHLQWSMPLDMGAIYGVFFFLPLLLISSAVRSSVITLISLPMHGLLCLWYPITHVESGATIPSVTYRWPDGQGDAAKFLHGCECGERWRTQYGCLYRIWSGATPEIVSKTPPQLQIVFKDSDRHIKAIYNDSGHLMNQLLGDCLGLISQDSWKCLHTILEPYFTYQASSGCIPLVLEHTRRRMTELRSAPSVTKGYLHPSKDLKMHPFWIVAELLYGKLSQDMKAELERIAAQREQIFTYIIAGRVSRFEWCKWLPIVPNRLFASFQQQWYDFNERARATAVERDATRAPFTVIYAAIEAQKCTESQISQTLDEMLFANLDVIRGALTWNLIQLAANQDTQENLRAEIGIVRASASSSDTLTEYLNDSTTYLSACILECSRLRPLAAFSVPQSAPTTRVIDGFHIAVGTNFLVDAYSLNQHNSYWGDDSSSFRPDRFTLRRSSGTRYNLWRFGFGPRQCLGRYLADIIIRALLVQLVKSFETGPPDGGLQWQRDESVWIDEPDMKLSCKKRNQTVTQSSAYIKRIWQPDQEFSGFQISKEEVAKTISDDARDLLQTYARFSADEVLPHVLAIVSTRSPRLLLVISTEAHRLGARGGLRSLSSILSALRQWNSFRRLAFTSHPGYVDIKTRLSKSRSHSPRGLPTFLDLGTCFGQDMRMLARDGADVSNSIGIDFEQSFLDMGHELFRDTESEVHTAVADIFDEHDAIWQSLNGKVDIVHAANFFHMFDWERQTIISLQIARLLRFPSPESRSVLVGCNIGSTHPREVPIMSKEKTSFCHNEASFRRLWGQVEQRLGMKFEVMAAHNVLESRLRVDPLKEESMRMLTFLSRGLLSVKPVTGLDMAGNEVHSSIAVDMR